VTTDAEAIAALNLDAPGMDKVKTAVLGGDLAAIQRAYLDYRRTSNPAKWRIMPSDEPAATAVDDPAGDKVCEHILSGFPDFTPAEFSMGNNFNWTANPVWHGDPGFTDEWTYRIVSRTPFWEKLADAYWRTHDEKYAAAWVDQLEDFAAKNPVNEDGRYGRVQLWRTLDSAIRMHESWPYAYAHFLNSPSFTPEANWLYLKLILDHATYLVNQLKNNPGQTGNWISTQCFGIYTMGTLFPELKKAASWRQIVIERMSYELVRMVPPDGFEVELSPWYHLESLDAFKGVFQLAELNHTTLPGIFKFKIISMYRALVIAMDQSGNVVPTNDGTATVNAVETAKQGLAMCDDPLLKWAATGGKSGHGLPASTMLPYAGFYTMRSGWNPDDLFLFFRAGPAGLGHEHEDKLEIVLRAWNKTLLPDSGGYMYDHSDWRRFSINTPAFSTIIVDGLWQHRDSSQAPVREPANNPWITTPLFDFVAGTYGGGYQKNVYNGNREFRPEDWVGPVDHSVTHTRRVLYLRPYYALLVDTLDGSGHHTFDSHFQLDAPAAHIDDATQAAFSDNNEDVQLALYPLEKDNLEVAIVQGQKHPLLGWWAAEHRAIPTVRFRKVQDAPAIFATFLYPYRGTSSPSFNGVPLAVAGDGVWGRTLTTPQEKAEVALVTDGTSKSFSLRSRLLGEVSANASGIVIRRPAGKTDTFFGGWAMTSYSDDKTQFTFDAPADVVVDGQGDDVLFYNGGDKAVNLTMTRPFTQTVSLASGAWTDVSARGGEPALHSPVLFGTLEASAP
jgi:hypothetical protein